MDRLLVSIGGGKPQPQAAVVCSACGKQLTERVAVEAATGSEELLFCMDCSEAHVGPSCRGCGRPAPAETAVIAANSWWHRSCLRCAEPGCGVLLSAEYFLDEGAPFCAEHHLLRTAELCARCELPVAEGISALGRAWHRDCFTCASSGKPIDAGEFYVHDGRTLSPAEQAKAAPPCVECNQPAVSDRLFALGRIYHRACFVCVHCRAEIGSRRFVEHDGEVYLEGCYHSLFGVAASREVQAAVQGDVLPLAVMVPLSIQKLQGVQGQQRFVQRHDEMLPAVRRKLREYGVTALSSFFFSAQTMTRPALFLSMSVPDSVSPKELLQQVLHEERVCNEWDQLLSSVHDNAASKGQPWWASATTGNRELTPT